jgi:uncharacterized protein (TIGR02271 family)
VSDTSGRNVKVDRARLREGMEVYSAEGQRLGRIERLDADEVTVDGRRYAFALIDRIQGDRVTLARQAGTTTDRVVETEGQMRVPVREERLTTDTRQVERGDVQVTKTVTSEQQTVPVELTREEVHVEQTDTADRPASEAEAAGAFQEGTIRVPVRGEEAVARKETVVTGEVVIDKTTTTETQDVTGTVRREHVEVDEAAGARGTEAVGPVVGRAGLRDVVAEAEVVGADGSRVGRVKEVRRDDFLVDRSGQRDVYVPLAAVADASGGRVRLAVRADAVDDQGWPNPPLL